MQRARVLHVDDDPDLLATARHLFEADDDARVAVETADGPGAGLDRLDAGVDCLVSDSMVTPDGESFVATARRRAPDLPVVAYTGAPLDDVLAEAPVDGYVRKGPGALARLREVVAAACDRHRGSGPRPPDAGSGDGWVLVARHDGDDGELVGTLAAALAALDGAAVDGIDPLFDVVDVEALDRLLDSMDPQSAGVVDASIGDRRVRLGADGTIAVRPADGA